MFLWWGPGQHLLPPIASQRNCNFCIKCMENQMEGITFFFSKILTIWHKGKPLKLSTRIRHSQVIWGITIWWSVLKWINSEIVCITQLLKMTRERKENSWTQTAPNSYPRTYIHGLQKCDRIPPPSVFSLLEVIEGLFGGFNMRARVFLRNKLFIKDRQHEQKILSIQFLLNRDWMFLPRILTNCFIEWVVIQVTPVTDPSYRLRWPSPITPL